MNSIKTIRASFFTVFILVGLLTGCAAGPDFKRPTAPDVAAYTATQMPDHTAFVETDFGQSQRFVDGGRVNPQWWREFGSPELDALIEEALQTSPSLAGSRATLRQAQELFSAQSGSTLYPQVNGNLGAQRQRFNPGVLGQAGEAREFSLYSAGVGVHYNLDLAGGSRRALEAMAANVDYQRYQLEAMHLMLAGNIITTAVSQARLAAQLQATETILHFQEEHLELTRDRLNLGQASPDDMLALQIQVEQTRAGIPLLRNQFQRTEHLLAVLAGHPPGEKGLPSFTLQEFTLPADLPLVVPSELVRARPDIQASEAVMHAANAQYGAAIARRYPRIALTADLGSQALTIGALFGSGSAIWSLAGQLTQPIFNPGLPAEKRAALTAFDAAAANYQTVVLESLRNVADVLRALENDAHRLTALSAADGAARSVLESIQRQYALGAASYVQLLTAQQQAQLTLLSLIEVQALRLVDSAAFYQAMGGGSSGDAANITGSYLTSTLK